MEFCPHCGKLLVYKRKSKGAFYCMKCGYKSEPLEARQGTRLILGKAFNVAVVDRESLNLRTTPTVNVRCESCGGNRAETWAVAVGSIGVSDIVFYRCISCGSTWRQSE
jgi:DNA-directed RNA polymerase subunit M